MGRRRSLVILGVALMLAACSSEGKPFVQPTVGGARLTPSASSPLKLPRIEFNSTGPFTRPIKRAERDLQTLGLWKPLTRHLYLIRYAVYERGAKGVSANHLANAIGGVIQDEAGEFQPSCDIVFFSETIDKNSEAFRRYYAAKGYLQDLPFTKRAFYTLVLAHELAHCLNGPHGEKIARRWERKTLRVMQDRGSD